MSEIQRRPRRVTYTQLETLWEFLNHHRDVATGYNKTARARDYSKRKWTEVAQSLNADGNGAVKTWKEWSKYWNDYKSKLKKAVASNHASTERTGVGPSKARALSDIEKRFLQILGDSFGAGLPGVRIEPFNEIAEPRRRRRRGDPPMSQEAARQALINISQERAQQEQQRNEILLQLVDEIKQVKELLRTRLPVPELPETPRLSQEN